MITNHNKYTYEEATDLLGRVGHPKSMLDLGAGLRDGNISAQVCKLPLERLLSVEAFQPYIPILESVPVLAKSHAVLCEDILTSALEPADIAIMLDVLEHLPKEDALEFLARLKTLVGDITIFLPLGNSIGYYSDFRNMGNIDLQTHKSAWTAEELESLGFDVDVYVGFHTHVLTDAPVDAAWAIWKKADK